MSRTEVPISVVMPVYNSSKYLVDAVRSIQSQTLTDWELIAVDDGSTDDSPTILQGLAAADHRVRPILESHVGLTSSLNHAIELARGTYIARMDSDDVSLPMRFEQQVAFLESHPDVVAVGSKILQITPDGIEVGESFDLTSHEAIDAFHFSQRGSAIAHPTVLIRKAAFQDVGGYRPQFETAEDLDLWLRLAERGKLANLPQVLLKYRLHDRSVSHERRARMRETTYRVVVEACRRRSLPMPRRRNVGPYEFPFRLRGEARWARYAWRAGHHRTARQLAWHAVKKRPLAADAWQAVLESIAAPVVRPLLKMVGI
ncbi:MAG: glycosyltransferase [Planctomycetota bacterium]|nr:glycosyltransferase [Planctomycetota bacterium]